MSLWRARDFRLLWIGETTSSLGSSVASVASPLVAVVTLQANTFTIGLLAAAAWMPWLLIGLPAGAWVDRLAKRPMMLACNIASMLFFASIPVAAWSGFLTVTQLLVVALLGGTAKVFFVTAYRAYLPTLVSTGYLLEANAKLQGSESAVQIAGQGLSGVLAQAFGAVSGLVADAVSFGISVLRLRSIRAREPRPERTTKDRLRDEIGDGLRVVIHDPYLRVLTVFGIQYRADGLSVHRGRVPGAGPRRRARDGRRRDGTSERRWCVRRLVGEPDRCSVRERAWASCSAK